MSTARPGAVLLVTSAAAFLSSLDLFIVNIAFPDIRADFPGTDLGQMSWILNGYTVVFAAFLALAGRVADRFGHARVFLVGLAVFTLASAACAAAPGVWLLVAARAVQAVGAALVVPTSLSLLLAAYPAERAHPGRRDVGLDRRGRRGARPAARRAARRALVALGLPGQRAGRDRRVRRGAARAARPRGRPHRDARPAGCLRHRRRRRGARLRARPHPRRRVGRPRGPRGARRRGGRARPGGGALAPPPRPGARPRGAPRARRRTRVAGHGRVHDRLRRRCSWSTCST